MLTGVVCLVKRVSERLIGRVKPDSLSCEGYVECSKNDSHDLEAGNYKVSLNIFLFLLK